MARLSFSSLRVRLMTLVLLAVIPALGLIFYTAWEERREEEAQVREEALRLSHLTAAHFQRFFEGTGRLLVMLGEFGVVRRGDAAGCSALLARLLPQYPEYANLGVALPNGDLVCSAVPIQGRLNIADRTSFRLARQTGELTIGEFQVSRTTGKPVIPVRYPVVDPAGRVRMVINAVLDLERLNVLATEVRIPSGAALLLLSSDGRLLARYPDTEKWVGRVISDAAVAKAILANRDEGVSQAVGVDGVLRLYGFTPLSAPRQAEGLYAGVGIPVELAFAPVKRRLAWDLAWLGLATMLALAAAWVGGSVFILSPVRKLVRATERLAVGDLSARAGGPRGPGELDQLARGFDQMAEALELRQAEQAQVEARLTKLNECLLNFGPDPRENINRLVAFCGEQLGAACALYNRLENGMLCARGQWNVPPGFNPVDTPNGHICFDVIRGARTEPWVICDLPQTVYAQTDPNVLRYGLRTYLGKAVAFGDTFVGSLCMLYQEDRVPGEEDIELLGIAASAIGVEEKRMRAEEALAERTRQIEAVRVVSEEITRELDLTTVLDLITRRAVDLVRASSAVLRLWQEERGLLVPQSRIGVAEPRGTGTLNLRLGEGVAGAAAQRRQGLIVNDFRYSSYTTPALLARTTHTAVLAEPLLYRDRLVGVINLNREEPGQPFTEEDRQLLALFATQAAIAIENARSHAAAVRRGEELAALLRATRSVMAGLDLHESLERIVEEASRIAGTPHVKVLLLDRESQTLRVGAVVGYSPSLLTGRQFPPRTSLSGIVAETGQPLFVPDCQNDPRNTLAEEDRQLGLVTYLGLPIRIRDEILGVMTFNTAAPRQYRPDELAYLTSFAAQAAIAIENARLYADLKRAYEDVQRAQDGLIRAEKIRALGQMAAGIAHDLNNVLAAILAHVELLRLQSQEPKVQERLAMLETTATDGAQIVSRLQGFARQRPTGPLIPCDLAALVQEVVEITRPRWRDELQRRGVVIEIQVALEDLPPILGQPAEIREVLTNLILNAVDAMPEGGTLTLAGNATSEGVTLTVTDTGTGMPEDVRQRIFDPFFTTKGGQGTGLGLSVVYAIMQRHGGHVDVASTSGKGTTFTLRFRAVPAILPAESEAPLLPGPPRRILLIDDNPMVCQTVASLLRTAGHTVKEADGGAAGLSAFAEFPVDLVLTDLGMPDVNGWDVARAVKGRDPHLPVILLTGWGEQPNGDARESASRALVDRVIGKPFRLRDLLAAIAELTGSPPGQRRANPVNP